MHAVEWMCNVPLYTRGTDGLLQDIPELAKQMGSIIFMLVYK